MWIRFKFRSALSFDVVDIGDRPAISVGELKSKIVAHKNLKLCHDFDLVFSDHLSGQEYDDENYQIRSNSSVIIKRVPAGSVPPPLPINSIENLVMKKSDILQEKGGEMDDFDDFGIDLCPVPEKGLPYSDLESERKNISDTEKAYIVGSRLGGQKLQANGLVQVIPKGSNQCGTEGKLPPEKLEPNVQTDVKLGKRAIDPYDLAEKNATLPPELRCPICTKYLKEAVMIPCCQQSFCEICIRGVLSEKTKCPKCSSDKFKAEHLLPNLSLRDAIKHFLEIQIQLSLSETVLRRYVPDEESCIQAKDIFSAIEKGANRLLGESFRESVIKMNVHHADSPRKPENYPGLDECQGENYPLHLHQNHVQEKGEDKNVPVTARFRKADSTCYMCDAPDHFIRDCPFADGRHPFLQTGNSMYAVGARTTFATPYWNNTAFGPMRLFTNIYANHGMMPYNASSFPVSPIGVSPYMASMYSHLPAYSGIPKMAGMAPLPGNRTENPLTHEDFLETRGFEIRGNHSKEYMPRRQPTDDDDIQTDHHNLPKSTKEYLFRVERENSGSYSGDKYTRRSRGNDLRAEHFDHNAHYLHDRHGKNFCSLTGTRDRKAFDAERSNFGVESMSNSSDRYVDERHYHRYHKITRNHYKRRRHFGSDSKRKEHHGLKDKSFSMDRRKRRREVDQCRSSKHARDDREYSRQELFCRSKFFGEDNYQQKRKRVR